MSDPAWLEQIREAYLADRASVFLLAGPGVAETWSWNGETDDFHDVLAKFLSGTREIVGLMDPPAALRFPGIGDVGRFERILSAAFLHMGKHIALQDDIPEEALGKIWLALEDRSQPQGYVITGIEQVYPEHRKRVAELGASAPKLWEWCTADRVRQSNHIVLLVTRDLSKLRPELVEAAEVIEVPKPGTAPPRVTEPELTPVASEPDVPETQAAQHQAADPAPSAPAPSRAARPSDEAIEALSADLHVAISAALHRHTEEVRPSKLPILDAVAKLMGERSGSPGPLTWALDEDGKPVPDGEGAEDFLARWKSDIVLDASAGMLIKELGGGSPDALNPMAIKALAKRLLKWG